MKHALEKVNLTLPRLSPVKKGRAENEDCSREIEDVQFQPKIQGSESCNYASKPASLGGAIFISFWKSSRYSHIRIWIKIYGYRLSLWAEHLGMVDDRFNEPNDLECVRFVNKIADDNWINFTSEESRSLTGHLIKYPVKVEADGQVGPLPGQECFPDVGGKILGSPTSLPDTLTM